VTAHLLYALRTRLEHEATLARLDSLTQILNARAFNEVCQRLVRLAERNQHPLAFAYIDVDDFRTVNDTAGHSAGDLVLQEVASTLARRVRSTDVIGRLGGDEFAVLMPETTDAGAQTAFAKIHDELQRDAAAHSWPIGFSIGVALFQSAPSSVDEALKVADALMYRAKQAGKNNVLYEEPGIRVT
jgi:diguanylate cyclase (GGDEF)-like protein